MAYEAGTPTATRPEPAGGTITVPGPLSIPESRVPDTTAAGEADVAVMRQGGAPRARRILPERMKK